MSKYILSTTCAINIITASAENKHSNEMPFEGVLVRLGEASTKAPNGSRNHKILIPIKVAEKHLKTLIGMGVNYSPDLDKHAPTHKVGVIKRAWIDGRDLKISGVVWKKDFPEATKDLNKSNLGMSFEADQIEVEDQEAPIWTISHLCFTGATILYKNAAAYYNTSAEALAAAASMSATVLNKLTDGGMKMSKTVKKKTIAAASPDLNFLKKGFTALTAAISAQTDAIKELIASSHKEEDDEEIKAGKKMKSADMQDDALDAGKKKTSSDDGKDDEEDDDDEDDEEDDDVDAEADDEDDLEEMDEDEDDGDDEEEDPGHVNKNAKENKGDKTSVSTHRDKNKTVKASGELAPLMARLDSLEEKLEASQAENSKLKKKLRTQKTQMEAAAADGGERKSVPVTSPLVANALAKGNIDVGAITASGSKATVAEIDSVLKNAGIAGVSAIAAKNELIRAGIMEEGTVTR